MESKVIRDALNIVLEEAERYYKGTQTREAVQAAMDIIEDTIIEDSFAGDDNRFFLAIEKALGYPTN